MSLPELSILTDPALLFLRLLLGVLFVSSGWGHVREPEARGASIGFSPRLTRLLGAAELAAGLSVGLGVLPQIGALVIIGVMSGAIHKKMFAWRTGFWGEEAGGGWFYDLLYLVCALVVVATGGGEFVLV